MFGFAYSDSSISESFLHLLHVAMYSVNSANKEPPIGNIREFGRRTEGDRKPDSNLVLPIEDQKVFCKESRGEGQLSFNYEDEMKYATNSMEKVRD